MRAGRRLREETDLRVVICGYRFGGGQSILLGVDIISLSLRCVFSFCVTVTVVTFRRSPGL